MPNKQNSQTPNKTLTIETDPQVLQNKLSY